jgi:hypothetical protein
VAASSPPVYDAQTAAKRYEKYGRIKILVTALSEWVDQPLRETWQTAFRQPGGVAVCDLLIRL